NTLEGHEAGGDGSSVAASRYRLQAPQNVIAEICRRGLLTPVASRHDAGKIGDGSPCVMRPLVEQSHGVDVCNCLACRELAGANRVQRRAPVLPVQVMQLIVAWR